MEPLTTALLAALAAAAGALLGGATDAAGGDAWAAAKTKLLGWMRLEERQQRDAVAQAVRVAVTTFRREQRPPPDAEVVLALFTIERAEARRFQQIALEELLFSARPNLGRLLDYYRRELRFAALLRREVAPAWPEIEPALRDFLSLLRQAIANLGAADEEDVTLAFVQMRDTISPWPFQPRSLQASRSQTPVGPAQIPASTTASPSSAAASATCTPLPPG